MLDRSIMIKWFSLRQNLSKSTETALASYTGLTRLGTSTKNLQPSSTQGLISKTTRHDSDCSAFLWSILPLVSL
ncbi:hypothetical protein VTO42DRAFT_3248 [Malbranchea cinnamomea]